MQVNMFVNNFVRDAMIDSPLVQRNEIDAAAVVIIEVIDRGPVNLAGVVEYVQYPHITQAVAHHLTGSSRHRGQNHQRQQRRGQS